jgi:hypothetical protein
VWWPAWHDIWNICSGNHDYSSADNLQLKPVFLLSQPKACLYFWSGVPNTLFANLLYIALSLIGFQLKILAWKVMYMSAVRETKMHSSLNSVIWTYTWVLLLQAWSILNCIYNCNENNLFNADCCKFENHVFEVEAPTVESKMNLNCIVNTQGSNCWRSHQLPSETMLIWVWAVFIKCLMTKFMSVQDGFTCDFL